MRFSLSILSSAAFLLPLLSGLPTVTASTVPSHLLSQAGVNFTGPAEFNAEAYQKLATLRKVFAPKTPTRTRKAVARAKRMTNAQRLALKLPLNPPKRRANHMRRQEPSPLPFAPNAFGISLAVDLDDNNLGYIGAALSPSGQLQVGTSAAEALGLTISLGSASKRGLAQELRIEAKQTSVDGLPLLALINGRDNEDTNLGIGSWHYLYVGTAEYPGTEPNACPSTDGFTSHEALTGMKQAFETDVWNLDTRTGTISATWINEDGTPIDVSLYEQAGVVLALADPEAFQAKYPAPLKPFLWKLVQAPSA